MTNEDRILSLEAALGTAIEALTFINDIKMYPQSIPKDSDYLRGVKSIWPDKMSIDELLNYLEAIQQGKTQ